MSSEEQKGMKRVLKQFFKDAKKLDKEGLPKEIRFNMRYFLASLDEYGNIVESQRRRRKKPLCGTVACFAGSLYNSCGRDYYSVSNWGEDFSTNSHVLPNFIRDFLFHYDWHKYDNTFKGAMARARWLYKHQEDPDLYKQLNWGFRKLHKLYTTPKGRIKKEYKTWE
jgi:hypothetical protein